MKHEATPSTAEVIIPQQTLPVRESFDVLVVGGGLAGTCAALAAARSGAKTLLTEALPYVGGNGTTGLPLSTFRAARSGPRIVGGIPFEIVERVRAMGGVNADLDQDNWIEIDCDLLQIALTHMFAEAGVHLHCHAPLLHAQRNGRLLTHAVFYSPAEPVAYAAKVFIDASGDAALACRAGLPTPMGRARDGKTQPLTLTFDVAGIDREQFVSAGGGALMNRLFEELRESHGWRNPRKELSYPAWVPGRPGCAGFNVTRVLVDKGVDGRQLSDAEREGRLQVEEFVNAFLRPHVPGFSRCRLARIAHRVGIRETRRIKGEYELVARDLVSCRKFEDAVACNSYPVDIHSPTGGGTHFETESLPTGGYYTIPYRSLVAKGLDNLLAAGRCISATHEALAAVRVLGCAMPVGEAAGTAAALCAQNDCAARDLDTNHLRQALKTNGAIVD